jgi:uncharacterized protein (TIGR03435 family)
MTRLGWIAGGVVIASMLVAAQTPAPVRFDVASIKRNRSLDRGIGGNQALGDTYRVTNITIKTLLQYCYGTRFIWSEIVGGPAWLEVDKFDIVAKTSGGRPTMAMVLSLLADRFKLRTHEELREHDVYRLVIDRADRQLGPKITPSRADEDRRRCTTRIQPGLFDGKCVTLGWLLDGQLQWAAQRRIIDETGLTGQFDIDLKWDPALESSPDQRVPTEAPSIFTAVREQLGLRLESDKARVPVLVIDSIEPPTEN